MGLNYVLKRKFVITTKSDHLYPIAENVLNRDFGSQTIGEKWVSNITYIRVKDDWNYLTTIMDLVDRKIVGWSLSGDMTVENTVWRAWTSAISIRKTKSNLIFLSDRGVQYASNKIPRTMKGNIKIKNEQKRELLGQCCCREHV